MKNQESMKQGSAIVRILGVSLAAAMLLAVNGFAADAGEAKAADKGDAKGAPAPASPSVIPAPSLAAPTAAPAAEKPKALPKLVDLGAIGCSPCKIMDGVLEELRKGYAGKLDVEFINVRNDAEKAAAYKIRVIPTQIWLDAAGKELFRHEGVMQAADIVKKFKELGVDLGAPAAEAKLAQPAPAEDGKICPPATNENGTCCP